MLDMAILGLLREGPTGLPDYPSRVLREDNGSILREG